MYWMRFSDREFKGGRHNEKNISMDNADRIVVGVNSVSRRQDKHRLGRF